MKQRWNHIFFLHGRVTPSLLQQHLPFELDLLDGMAILSIVPFKMDLIRLWNLPPVPLFSHLWEINLRTYVTVAGKPGVYFFTLDTDSALGCWIANHFFHLPYRLAKIKTHLSDGNFYFESQRSLDTDRGEKSANANGARKESVLTPGSMYSYCPSQNASLTQHPSGLPDSAGDWHEISGIASFKTSFHITGRKKKKTILDTWTTDRDRLFTLKRGEIYEGRVHHDSWPLEEVDNLIFEDHFSTQIPIECHFDPQESSYAPVLNVGFEPFKKVSKSSFI
ncbi:MAG: DUF2071 domain-containing protein [Chthoniobacterales bacterium]|nr:DUF2071 domain-containing protein [Chthoniobacterales bacterium]